MSAPGNPLRDALEARDVSLLEGKFADDAILRSPIFSVEFQGTEELFELFEVLYEVLGEIEYTLDQPGDPHVFAWKTEVGGEPLEGVDLVSYDDAGKINEVTVFMRPLRGIAAFLDKVGPKAAARRSRGKAVLMRAMGPPPSMMMRSVANLGPKMLGMKNAKR